MVRPIWSLRLLFVATLSLSGVESTTAQTAAPGSAGAENANEATAVASDIYGRATPRDMVDGMIAALRADDNQRAAQYLALRSDLSPEDRDVWIAALRQALDKGGRLPTLLLSTNPQGRIDDELPPDRERVGSFVVDGRQVPILAARFDGDPSVWRIAPETLTSLPRPAPLSTDKAVASTTKQHLDRRVGGAPVLDWLKLFALAAGLYLAIRLAFAIPLLIVRRRSGDARHSKLYRGLDAAASPLSVYIAVLLFLISGSALQVSIIARQTLTRVGGVIAWVALAWFLWRLTDAVAEIWAHRMRAKGRLRATSLTIFIRRAAKIALVGIAVVAVADTIGVDVTTGIAALGIGGIAIALGAQKTIENIVGSITVIVDEPVRIGDVCRVGDVTGTVIDIGIRSTRLRTAERTVVTIPNGSFASQQIENLSRRDRYLFNPTLRLRYDADSDDLRGLLDALRDLLRQSEDVHQEDARATLRKLAENGIEVEVFCHVEADSYDAALAKQESLLLQIMDLARKHGLDFAFPTRTINLVRTEPEQEH